MAYQGSYSYFTRRQCNVLYGAFKRGELVPPKDCRGRVKRPGFVYGFEGASRMFGHLNQDEQLRNGQLAILERVVGCVCEGKLDEAQRWLDCEHEGVFGLMPERVQPAKMWKAV